MSLLSEKLKPGEVWQRNDRVGLTGVIQYVEDFYPKEPYVYYYFTGSTNLQFESLPMWIEKWKPLVPKVEMK